MENQLNNDLTNCMEAINNHAQKDNIISMFIKGPPKNKGFMWCSKEGGPVNGGLLVRQKVYDLSAHIH